MIPKYTGQTTNFEWLNSADFPLGLDALSSLPRMLLPAPRKIRVYKHGIIQIEFSLILGLTCYNVSTNFCYYSQERTIRPVDQRPVEKTSTPGSMPSTLPAPSIILDDIEMYEQQDPFKLSDLISLSNFLNQFLYKMILDDSFHPETECCNPLFTSLHTLLMAIYRRDCQKKFCDDDHWLAKLMQ
ncbi:hypothetical protein TSAR_012716 [Trichomalopsis sarcophagae]|uniref:HECT-type E3 ubiquitin transferase n=1 Tax=Trichomalopsis sarcophagae TaxID=543379 RepID=A0A232FHD5_9HYME|nr:hypothetical protein TSAR_012716 [Trichomalopsis sarcophagae]